MASRTPWPSSLRWTAFSPQVARLAEAPTGGRCGRSGGADAQQNIYRGSTELCRSPEFEAALKHVAGNPLLDIVKANLAKLDESQLVQSLPKLPEIVSMLEYKHSANMFFSKGYSSAEPCPCDDYHPPPPAIARQLRMRSCKVDCEACKDSCLKCRYCCLHLDERDRSLTLVTLWQRRRVPASRRVWFQVDDKAYPIAGGLSVLFDAKKSKHCTWAPAVDFEKHDMWYGCAAVQQL